MAVHQRKVALLKLAELKLLLQKHHFPVKGKKADLIKR